jgi:hypothetical protein
MPFRRFIPSLLKTTLLIAMLASGLVARGDAPWSAVVDPENSLSISFAQGTTPVFRLALGGWGPNWAWVGVSAKGMVQGEQLTVGTSFVVDQTRGQVIQIESRVSQTGPRKITLHYDLKSTRDVPLTMLINSLSVEKAAGNGKLVLTEQGGREQTLRLPLGRAEVTPPVSTAALRTAKSGDITITIDPLCPIAFDGDMRFQFASGVFKRGSKSITMTLAFPTEIDFVAGSKALDRLSRTVAGQDWFPFHPSDKLGPSVIGMEDWLESPAGKHGGVRTVGDHFEFTDGTQVKFWGVNLSYGGGCAPPKRDAEFTAARFAKYGINGVRLHKFSYPKDQMGIGDANDATRMDPEGLDRLDYMADQLKKRGIYFGWSHSYGFHVCPGNRAKLLAYDEIAEKLHGNTYAFINFAEDVQDLMIEMVVNLLHHKNPYTGLTYAQEPALSYLEIQNEDDIFFYTSENALNACPTYRRLFLRRFSDWLTSKYGSEEKLRAAWQGALPKSESLSAGNVVPQVNPWFFGDDHLPLQKGGQRRRLLDTARFLHETQNRFYAKFVKAIHQAGYEGPLVGSPWQAPSMLPHYANLRSDYLAGYIDRHNYFGGGIFDTMLGRPGSGYFSSGLQQVADRPFGLSEWITVYPSLYGAEGPALIAAYGMGLQGWDASYEFQSQSAGRVFDDRAGWQPWGVWEADVPTQVGQFATLARMVYRGDVRESEVISTRRICLDDLVEGRFGFSDKVLQQGDVKSFTGSVPADALAAGRVVVEFTPSRQPSLLPEMDRFRRGTTIVSSTKQLAWDTRQQGSFTINTPGTKAVVGFAQGRRLKLGDVTITSNSPYASIVLTSAEKTATLANARRAILSVVARNCNTGFKYFALDQKILDNGKPPILLEPVKATIELAGRRPVEVHILDHDGRRTGRQLPSDDGRVQIDGTRDKAIYYEFVF